MITSPFDNGSTAAEVIAGHDLTGKVALITGASSGLDIETARALLSEQRRPNSSRLSALRAGPRPR